jgi:hypothetical protein
MAISSQHVTGFVIGLGVAGVGYLMYKKNQPKVDEFLRAKGISVPTESDKDSSQMSMEELVKEKERLEDIIAEREHEQAQQESAARQKKGGESAGNGKKS